jgi:hypothetical protein
LGSITLDRFIVMAELRPGHPSDLRKNLGQIDGTPRQARGRRPHFSRGLSEFPRAIKVNKGFKLPLAV